jgi:hypothetical protein
MSAFVRLSAVLWLLAASVASAPTARAEELPTFAVTLVSGRIEPSRLEVPAGRKFKLSLRNENAGPSEFEARDLRIEKVLAPGARSFVVIHPLKPGTYRFFDEFHPGAPDMELVAR